MNDIILICEKCSFPIGHGMGSIHIRSFDVSEGDLIRWHTAHDGCLSGDAEPVYDLDAREISTAGGLRSWTGHLMSKRWYPQSDWSELLREVSGEIPAVRVRVQARRAA